MKLFCWSTAHASSSVTRFMRSKMSSGTLGRPSAKRSPCQSGVYLMTSSRVKNPCCALALCADTATRDRNKIANGIRLSFLVIVLISLQFTSGFVRFKPGCSRNLCFSGDFFIHLNADAGLITHSDITLLDDFTFLHPVLPKIGEVDPVPFANQEVGNRGTNMSCGHDTDRRHNTMGRDRHVICLRQIGYLAAFR